MEPDKLQPTLIRSLRKYSFQKFLMDLGAGALVAVIALPLSIALAIASGVRPENGLYSAIIGGFFVSLLSGSKVQIGGVTAATVMTVSMIINQHGMTGLAVSCIMAGIFLIIMGVCRLGGLLKYIPITITTGFTAGIAIGIFTSQIKEFLGLSIEQMPIKIYSKWMMYFEALPTISWVSVAVGVASIAILIIALKISPKVPNALVMIVIMTVIVKVLNVPVNTVGSVYGELPSHFPLFEIPKFHPSLIEDLFMPSLTLAILIAIVSLLSCVVTDGMIGKRHNSNMELIAQGVANIFCGLFSAVPVAGAVARSANSVKNGGKSGVVGIVHSIVVCIILMLFMPLVGYIPMPSLAALLILVSFNMINWKEVRYAFCNAPKSDAIVLSATVLTAVFIDLMAAVEVGVLLTAMLFMKRMAEVTSVEGWKYIEDENEDEEDPDSIELKVVPKHTQVYEICGPLFFAASDKLMTINLEDKGRCLILRMRSVTSIDATAMHRLEYLYQMCKKKKVKMILSHVNEQPLSVMKKAGFDTMIGEENICLHIDEALDIAKEYCKKR